MTFHNSNDNSNSNNLSPVDKIELKPIDLESINKKNKKNKNINKEKRFSIGGWFNIFNKNFEIKFKWRF